MRAGVRLTIIGTTENALGSSKISIAISKRSRVMLLVTSFSPGIAGRGPKTTHTTIEVTAINSSITKTRKMTTIIDEKTAKKEIRKAIIKVAGSRVSGASVSS